jgi:hypothetical protein
VTKTQTPTQTLTNTDTDGEHDEDSAAASGSQVHNWPRPQDTWNSGGVHPFTWHPSRVRIQEAPHVNKDSTPITIFLLFFMEVIQLLVAETNKYSNQYLDTFENDGGCLRFPDVTVQEMYTFLDIIIQMGHVKNILENYWLTAEQFFTPLHTNTMKCDIFPHILRFIHFSDNMNQPDKNDNNYDRVWKMRTLSDQFNNAYDEFYNLSEHLAVDAVIMPFKGRAIFKQYI